MRRPKYISEEWYQYMTYYFQGFYHNHDDVNGAIYDMWTYYKLAPEELLVIKKQIDDLLAADYSDKQLRKYWLTEIADIIPYNMRDWFESLRDSLKQFLADHPDFLPTEYRDKF